MTSEVEIEVTSQKGVNARAQELKEKANQSKEYLRYLARKNLERFINNATKKSS